MRVEETERANEFVVSGRGELHLAIFIETIRREGYEFSVSRPEVIFKEGPHGEMLEPIEQVFVEVAQDYLGVGARNAGQAARPDDQYSLRRRWHGLLHLFRADAWPFGLSLAIPHRHAWHRDLPHALPRL